MNKPTINIIAAVGKNNVIGLKNALPWNLPADLKYFAQTTKGKTVLMGENTFISILEKIGKPLSGRRNIVLTDKNKKFPDVETVNSLEAAMKITGDEEIFVIGGASVYRQMLPLAEKLYITEVNYDGAGDAFFPTIDQNQWLLEKAEPHTKDNKNDYDYNFKIYRQLK
ncbi:MAG: dihydrofolate reductase [Parcubacteria group bacterium Gr01-1014_73]|nr:MAG: dihydrofolate reductase [Parcubacteria group bacterium Gr01-1014_73]